MLKILVLVVVTAVVVMLSLAATRPHRFRVQRAIDIQAPAPKVYALLQDFHEWQRWSPWEKLDPALQRKHSGATSGPGAVYAWHGNNKVGQGRMEIRQATAPTQLSIQLDFLKPFEAHNTADFVLEQRGDSTHVLWAIHGPQPFIAKLMGLFFDMDRMVGKDFETGLANLKAIAEQP